MTYKRIIYGAPSSNTPSGGVKVIYRHSEILNDLGVSSGVWHPSDDEFQCNWFDNKVKLIKTSEMDPSGDFIILPEIWASTHTALFKNMGFKVGIYVQNCYYTHFNLDKNNNEAAHEAYQMADIILSISQDTTKYLIDVLNVPVRKIQLQRYSINSNIFRPGDKVKTITYMPRKMSDHSSRVVAILNNRLPLNGWEMKSINNLSEQRVAEELSRSIIFLAFSEFEGLPVPPVEAALSGNYVIGYDGQGGKEYWHEPNFTRIEQGDIQGFVNKIMKRISKIDDGDIDLEEINVGIERLSNYFSADNEIELVNQLVDKIKSVY